MPGTPVRIRRHMMASIAAKQLAFRLSRYKGFGWVGGPLLDLRVWPTSRDPTHSKPLANGRGGRKCCIAKFRSAWRPCRPAEIFTQATLLNMLLTGPVEAGIEDSPRRSPHDAVPEPSA